MATAVEAFAPAKINLTLHVTGQREDGYHLLDSLVVFADLGDRLRVAEAPGLNLTVRGPMSGGVPVDKTNSVLRAAQFMGQDNLHFTLEKHLPSAAGIGGGTSDAAAALNAIAALRKLDLPKNAAPLGADVPVCLMGRATRMSGIGDVLAPVDDLPPLEAVLVNPGVAVSTPQVFKRLTRKDNPPMPDPMPRFVDHRDLAGWLATQRNDLQAPAIAAQPEISDVLTALEACEGQLLSRMSGSGATCFALFDTPEAADAAERSLSRDHPRWWVKRCRLS